MILVCCECTFILHQRWWAIFSDIAGDVFTLGMQSSVCYLLGLGGLALGLARVGAANTAWSVTRVGPLVARHRLSPTTSTEMYTGTEVCTHNT